jgi:hypothetical protein
MSDEQLRSGERRWRAGGDPEDEARALRARVRFGRANVLRLALAAEVGHRPAQAALDGLPGVCRPGESFASIAATLERAGDEEARLRAAIALAHALIAADPRGDALRALEACEDWLRSRGLAQLGHALRAWRAVVVDPPRPSPELEPSVALLRLAVLAVEQRGATARAVAHLRAAWVPWLVS